MAIRIHHTCLYCMTLCCQHIAKIAIKQMLKSQLYIIVLLPKVKINKEITVVHKSKDAFLSFFLTYLLFQILVDIDKHRDKRSEISNITSFYTLIPVDTAWIMKKSKKHPLMILLSSYHGMRIIFTILFQSFWLYIFFIYYGIFSHNSIFNNDILQNFFLFPTP